VQNLLKHLLLPFNGTPATKLTPIILPPLSTSATADTKHSTCKKYLSVVGSDKINSSIK
jgi:hypothetical protein